MSKEVDLEYKKNYTKIFVFFYLVQGFVQGIPFLVFPPYIAQLLGNKYDIAQWLIIASIGSLPWAIKMIIGVINDKWGSEKYGRRFPFIISFGIFGGIWWFIMAIYLPTDESIYFYMAFYYFMIALGMAFADTALDGLILDVTPKEKLGKVQGLTWTCLLLGMGAGGMLLGLIFLALNMIPVLFIITGILMIIACIFPYFIEELPIEKMTAKQLRQDFLSIFTRKKNYKVLLFTFTSSITGVLITSLFGYLVLISLGIIEVDETVLSITQGSAVDLLGWTSVFNFMNGAGTVIGAIITGKFADKHRKKAVTTAYLIYIPFCLVSVIPFMIFGNYLIALIFGLLWLAIFGMIQAALLISSQTVRGDLVKKEYPNIKSTYYALLVSFWNGGQTFGMLLGALLITVFALYVKDFTLLYFFVSLFCAGVLTTSFLFFRLIDPKDYELEHILGEEHETYFG